MESLAKESEIFVVFFVQQNKYQDFVWTLSKLHWKKCFIEWREHYNLEPKNEMQQRNNGMQTQQFLFPCFSVETFQDMI